MIIHSQHHKKHHDLDFLSLYFLQVNAAAWVSTQISAERRVEAERADVLLASSLPGLVSTATFHLKNSIQYRYTNSHVCVCVCKHVCMCVQVRSLTIQIVLAHTDTENDISVGSVNACPNQPIYSTTTHHWLNITK